MTGCVSCSVVIVSRGPGLILFFFFLMIRRPPRSTLDRSSAASDVYKRQEQVRNPVGRVHVMGAAAIIAGVLAQFQKFFNIQMPGFQTVSYTHLRAHETVLDLVCRLLLEKKKYLLSSTQLTVKAYYQIACTRYPRIIKTL